MDYKIAILITTFLRDNTLYKTIQSIVDNYNEDCIVLIADQGYNDPEKLINIDYYKSQIALEYYRIPFDSGLSAGRNFLVQKASEMSIPYCLVSADSIQMTAPNDYRPIISFLEADDKRGMVGFNLEGSKCAWEFLMEVTEKGIQFSYPTEKIEFSDVNLIKVDICRNIFIAKTQSLLDLWDKELKVGEHEMAFIEYKKRGYEVYWTDYYSFKKSNVSGSDEYKTYRDRLGNFLKIVKRKLNMTGWVIYPKGWKCK